TLQGRFLLLEGRHLGAGWARRAGAGGCRLTRELGLRGWQAGRRTQRMSLLEGGNAGLERIKAVKELSGLCRTTEPPAGLRHSAPEYVNPPPHTIERHLLVGNQGPHLTLILLDPEQVGAGRAAGGGCQAQRQANHTPVGVCRRQSIH
ncbi:MAG: hypothetical protein ACE5I7_17150, partial [Candidatus Binatia bacterium]